jgi:hypothetical protein
VFHVHWKLYDIRGERIVEYVTSYIGDFLDASVRSIPVYFDSSITSVDSFTRHGHEAYKDNKSEY